MNFRTAALVAVVMALVNLQPSHGYVHTNIGSTAETTLSDDCQSQYNDLLASIPVPPEPLLDAGELNCTDQISNATANTDGVYCPSQAVLVACFQVIISYTCVSAVAFISFRDRRCHIMPPVRPTCALTLLNGSFALQLNQTAWTNLVGNCDLFTSAPNCLNGGVADAITGSACQRPRQSNGWWLFSATQGKFAIEQYDYGTGIVPNAGSDWQTVQGEGVSCHLPLKQSLHAMQHFGNVKHLLHTVSACLGTLGAACCRFRLSVMLHLSTCV